MSKQVRTQVQEKAAKVAVRTFQRRHWILAAVGAVALVFLLKAMLPLIPRTAKPTHYNVGDWQIEAMTEVVGYRKVVGIIEGRSGDGRLEAASYRYRLGENPQQDIESYAALLQQEHSAVLDQQQPDPPSGGGVVALTIPPAGESDLQLTVTLSYDSQDCVVQLASRKQPQQRPDVTQEVNVTPQQAQELLLTLTKAETGFKQDISVYSVRQEEQNAQVDGWDYYVFTVEADYSATRVEYRGTFYVGCYDGVVLKYDKETGETSRLRGSMNETSQNEETKTETETEAEAEGD